jgi:hypothetical protein
MGSPVFQSCIVRNRRGFDDIKRLFGANIAGTKADYDSKKKQGGFIVHGTQFV